MATTTRGVAVYKFGTYTVAGFIVNEGTVRKQGEEYILDNEDGQNVTQFTNFGLKNSLTLLFIPLSGTAIIAVDGVVTYNGVSGAVTSEERVTVKRQPEAWRITVSGIPGISYS